jgi:SNF2 family DNA or RNA helicase
LDRVQQNRVIITNYESIRNYQHSFAYFRNGKSLWSVLVTDEAQEYKVPNTKISPAIKALKPDFHIASTGTPVENRLLDLWNIWDTFQPGYLGAAREFTATYERHANSSARDTALTNLKERLLFNQPPTFVLRREKSQVATLPEKTYVPVACQMSRGEIDLHLALVTELGGT